MRTIRLISKVTLIVSLLITVGLFVVSFWGDQLAILGESATSKYPQLQRAFLENVTINGLFGYTYIITAIALVVILAFTFYHLITNVKALIYFLSVIVGFAILVLWSYYLSDKADNPEELMSDVGLITTYHVMGITILTIVVTEVYNAFK